MSTGTSLEATPPSRRSLLAYIGMLALMVAATYGHAATAFFVSDDFHILTVVSSATNLREVTGIAHGWEFFRPLTAITFWGTYLLFGMSATAFHVFDLVAHAGNAFLVAWVAWLIFPSRLGAAFAGACFAVIPTGAECVTWISGRFDVLCVTGALLSLVGWLRFLLWNGGRGAIVLSGLGLVVGLFAKDTGMILPLFLGFLALVPESEGWPVRRGRWRALGVLLLVFAACVGFRHYVLGGFGGYQQGGQTQHLTIDLDRAGRFVRDAVHSILAPGTHWILSALACGLGATILAAGLRGMAGRLWPLVVCFAIALAPAANLIELDLQTGKDARFLYLPSVFACVGIGLLFGQAAKLRSIRVFGAIGLLLLGSYGWSLVVVNQRWRVAGDIAETVVEQLRTLCQRRDYEQLFVHDLPATYRGAFVYYNGFEMAVKLFVSDTVELPSYWRISRADWDEHSVKRRANPETYHPNLLMLRWMPGTRRLIEP